MEKSLLIVGAGEFGQLVKELAETLGYSKIDFLDDNAPCAIGKVEDYRQFISEYKYFIVAIGNPIVRREMVAKLSDSFELCTLVHPSATVSGSAIIGNGCVIEAHTVINTAAYVEDACFVNAGAIVNHNSIVKEYSQIDCNAVVAADAVVPPNTKVESCALWRAK